MTLDADLSNRDGPRGLARGSASRDWAVRLETPIDALERGSPPRHAVPDLRARSTSRPTTRPRSRGAVRKHVPRFGRSAGSAVSRPRNGWIAVYDDLVDRDRGAAPPARAGALDRARRAVVFTISLEEGAVVRYLLVERGSVVDEYLSVPEHFGELPPGDVVALGANPTAVARLTGADPRRVRAVARTASSAGELPPAPSCSRRSPRRSGSRAPSTATRRRASATT